MRGITALVLRFGLHIQGRPVAFRDRTCVVILGRVVHSVVVVFLLDEILVPVQATPGQRSGESLMASLLNDERPS